MIHNEQEYRTMLDLEQRLWWYRILYHKLENVLRSAPRDIKILDIGCGTGGVIFFLQQKGFHQVRGIDVSPYSIKVSHERGLKVEMIDALSHLEQLPDNQLDVILFMDSLTYIKKELHETVIKECSRVLKPGGKIILNSAALEAFRGIHDEHVGTVCRLNKNDYRKYAGVAGLKVQSHYWPFFLGVIIFLIRLKQRVQLKLFKKTPLQTDLNMPPHWLNELFFKICLFENRISSLSLFGSSLFGVLAKPSANKA